MRSASQTKILVSQNIFRCFPKEFQHHAPGAARQSAQKRSAPGGIEGLFTPRTFRTPSERSPPCHPNPLPVPRASSPCARPSHPPIPSPWRPRSLGVPRAPSLPTPMFTNAHPCAFLFITTSNPPIQTQSQTHAPPMQPTLTKHSHLHSSLTHSPIRHFIQMPQSAPKCPTFSALRATLAYSRPNASFLFHPCPIPPQGAPKIPDPDMASRIPDNSRRLPIASAFPSHTELHEPPNTARCKISTGCTTFSFFPRASASD
jgi:hypothetical protein